MGKGGLSLVIHLVETSDLNRERQWHPTPVLLPGKSHEQRSLVGCSPWGHEGWDTTERLHFHFSLSCIGEGNGNPLHCSCLENPRDRGAWWAHIYGVTQNRTWLKRLSNSSALKTEFLWAYLSHSAMNQPRELLNIQGKDSPLYRHNILGLWVLSLVNS